MYSKSIRRVHQFLQENGAYVSPFDLQNYGYRNDIHIAKRKFRKIKRQALREYPSLRNYMGQDYHPLEWVDMYLYFKRHKLKQKSIKER